MSKLCAPDHTRKVGNSIAYAKCTTKRSVAVRMTPGKAVCGSVKDKLLAAGLPVSMVLLASSSALAVDGKQYPGALCKPLNNNTAYTINSARGDIVNPNSSGITVHCPGINDEGVGPVTGRVFVVDANGGQDVSCTLRSVSQTGAALGSQTRNTLGVNTGVQRLPASGAFSVPRQANSYYFFDCFIPGTSPNGASRIVNYFLEDD